MRVRLMFAACALMVSCAAGVAAQTPAVTFSADLAPVVYRRCAPCHHPGGTAPFDLTTYATARQHARQMAEATATRYMPPWKAAPGPLEFLGEQRLDASEIDLFRRWVEGGASEGEVARLPPPPRFSGAWQLGTPDLVVSIPAYTLAPEGTDVFRVFVVPLPVGERQYVRGLEFRSGSSPAVHHATIRVDRTRASRALDEADPAPGYEGLIARSATYPDGHFLAWTPGQVAPLLPKGLAWTLEPGTDLVVELHFQQTGRPEVVQPSIGVYFGSDPPERIPAMLRLGRQRIDISPGDTRYVLTDGFVLPVDVEVLAVQPHAHSRARVIRGTATRPDGTTTALILIPDWDFRWQQVYRYRTPLALPKGTRLSMEYVYDNSAGNLRNLPRPPQRVVWGQRSGDEMGDLWIQVLTKHDQDLDTLVAAFRPKQLAEDIIGYHARLEVEPSSVALHDDLALLYLEAGRPGEAAGQFARSAALRPEVAASHFNLATSLTLLGGRDQEAVAEYRRALAIRPGYALAHNNLGGIFVRQGRWDQAFEQFGEAVRLEPEYAEALDNLGRLYLRRAEWRDAVDAFDRAVRAKPDWTTGLCDLASALATIPDPGVRNTARANDLVNRAAQLTGRPDSCRSSGGPARP